MIRGQKAEAVGQGVLGSVREPVVGFASDNPGVEKVGQVAVEGYFAETDDNAHAGQSLNLLGEVGGAVADLLWEGFVSGWSAAYDGGDPGVAELEAVVTRGAGGLAGKPQLIEDRVHEGAGAVAGEGPAGAVGSVSAGSQAKDENAGAGIAETGDGAGPVGLILIGAAFGFADAPAVVAEPGATLTSDDGVANLLQVVERYLYVGTCHSASHDSGSDGGAGRQSTSFAEYVECSTGKKYRR